MQQSTSIERLTHLIGVLEWVRPEQLNMMNWCTERGLVYCVVGWATQDPGFQLIGLGLSSEAEYQQPTYNGLLHWDAVAAFFGITTEVAAHLFDPICYLTPDELEEGKDPTKEDVIKRLNDLIAEIKGDS